MMSRALRSNCAQISALIALSAAPMGCGDGSSSLADASLDGSERSDAGEDAAATVVDTLTVTLLEDTSASVEPHLDELTDAPLTYSVTTAKHGVVTGSAPPFVYTPDADYAGADSFIVQASEALGAMHSVEIALTILPVNDAPLAADLSLEMDQGTELAVLIAASDADEDVLSYAVVDPPRHGTLRGTAPGLRYVPDGAFFGEDTFTFTASDGILTSNTGSVHILIDHVIRCGDGITEGFEGCDDGNDVDTDSCRNGCVLATCGDGVVDARVEACDDGNLVDDDACRNNCVLSTCGDGVINPPEQCDDRNQVDNDACRNNCLRAVCGDSVIYAGVETCDDGNTALDDGCDASCHVETFNTTSPVKISANLTCTTAPADAADKLAVDTQGTVYAVMTCAERAYVAISKNRGRTFGAPFELSSTLPNPPFTVRQVAVASGTGGITYVSMLLGSGTVYLRSTQNAGSTWSAPFAVGSGASAAADLSLEPSSASVYVSYANADGVVVARSATREGGVFTSTSVSSTPGSFDLRYDPAHDLLAICSATPAFQIITSTDGGLTFGSEYDPVGLQPAADWAIGANTLFGVGSDFSASGDPTLLYSFSLNDLATAHTVQGLPSITSAHMRSIAANTRGDAFVVSGLDSGGIQLDRLAANATSFSTPRPVSTTGTSPAVAALPGALGAAVSYSDGDNSVYVTVQTY